jgi:hypothetical protein
MPLQEWYYEPLMWKALVWLSYGASVPLRLPLKKFLRPCGKYARHGHDWVFY